MWIFGLMSQYPINNFPNLDDLHGPSDSEENNNKKINFGEKIKNMWVISTSF